MTSRIGCFDDLTLDKWEIEAYDFDSSGKMYVLMNAAGKKDPIYVSKKAIV